MRQNTSVTPGTFYVVATPIGNLEDITLRALRILKEVDCIAAEDTRHTKNLLNHFGIKTRLISCYREQEAKKAEYILELLQSGQDIAIVSDAGTPGISDPGAIVINKIRQADISVVPIPGPSALSTALSCAGIEESAILFLGFPPAKTHQRKQLLSTLIHTDYHVVFYESPHRVSKLLKDAYEILGDRKVFLARELTKAFEEVRWATLSELIQVTSEGKNRGEYVLLFAPGEKQPPKEMSIDELILWYRDKGELSLKDTCKNIASDLGLSRSKIYQRAIQIWKDGTESQ